MNHNKVNSNSDTIIDKQILLDLIGGSERAFEEIYKRCFPHIRNYSISLVGDSKITFDIIQNIFVSLWENRRRLDA